MILRRISRKLLSIAIGASIAWTFVRPAAAQPFTFTPINSTISRLAYGSVSLADLNGDGNLDVLFTGTIESSTPYTPSSGVAVNLASTDPDERRIEFNLTPLATKTWLGKAAWNDVDLDGDLDFVLTGSESDDDPFDDVALLYRAGNAWQAEDVGLEAVHSSVVRWADTDNDGDSDLLVMGRTASGDHSVRLYRNDGGQTFTELPEPFPALAFGDAAWGDYDNDGDFDLVLSGVIKNGQFDTGLYRNDGHGDFVRTGQVLRPLAFSALAWGDYDQDGDLDLALSGAKLGSVDVLSGVTILYRNDAGALRQTSAELSGSFYGGLSWADYDLDGDLDLFVMGRSSMGGAHVGIIYMNDGGAFTPSVGLVGTSTSNADWGDIDGDRDVDAIVSGISLQGIPFTRIYRNDSRLVNAVPHPPTSLSAAVDGSSVVLSWNRGEDEETASDGLTYAVRVGTTPGGSQIMSAYASPETGRRILPGFGNVQTNTSWPLKGLASGVYYWSVQAIDNSLIGSPFAPESQFTITSGGKITAAEHTATLPDRLRLYGVYPNPVREQGTVSFDLPKPDHVRIAVFDVLGKEVGVLLDEDFEAGSHHVAWSSTALRRPDVSSGMYFLRMNAGSVFITRPMVILK